MDGNLRPALSHGEALLRINELLSEIASLGAEVEHLKDSKEAVEITHRINEDGMSVFQLCEKVSKLQDELGTQDAEIIFLTAQNKKLEADKARLREALEKMRSTNGLQYSDLFQICDEALAANKESK